VEQLADSDAAVARHIRTIAFGAIDRLQRRTVLLGRGSALEKVGAFLLEMAARGQAARAHWIDLPMCRCDIADYLAMAVETVSRTLTQLRARGVIAFRDRDARQVRIGDRDALEGIANGTSECGVRQESARARRRDAPAFSARSL
jgi:CRP-like cAMP-binding protein